MDFADKIRALAVSIPKQREHVLTEEATKNAFVMPFINALGFNVFDPLEVQPEYTADVGVKKGEKVDYAILRGGAPILLFECKCHDTNLDSVLPTQLFRYFSTTEAPFAVLTNGIVYRFFTDLDEKNKLDGRHFFELDLLDLRENAIEELKKFSKSAFDPGRIRDTASELKYTREIRRLLADEMNAPSDEFVRLFARQVNPGRMLTQAVREQFAEFTKRAFHQLLNDRINERLDSAKVKEESPGEPPSPAEADDGDGVDEKHGIVTTDEEREAFHIVRAILCAETDIDRIVLRDQKGFCSVLLDDTNRKPICRFRFSETRLQVGFIGPDKGEEIVTIDGLSDLYRHAARLQATVGGYDRPSTS